MPPSSGELWGHHLMPQETCVDALLPNGNIVTVEAYRDATLETVKSQVFTLASQLPLFHLLENSSLYVFIGVTQEGQREEFYDETRRICDLHLFTPLLKLEAAVGNREENTLNYEIGLATGLRVSEFNESTDLEVMTFRRNILNYCREVVEDRDSHSVEHRVHFMYPPELAETDQVPAHLVDPLSEKHNHLFVAIFLQQQRPNANVDEQSADDSLNSSTDSHQSASSSNYGTRSITMKVPCNIKPSALLAEAVLKCFRRLESSDRRCSCEELVKTYHQKVLLKACGTNVFFLADLPIIQYYYIQECLTTNQVPQLMFVSWESVTEHLPPLTQITAPSCLQKGISALDEYFRQRTVSSWDRLIALRSFTLLVKCVSYIPVQEGIKVYTKAGLFHGREPLCPVLCTDQADCMNPRWDEALEFDVALCDLPRSARLCIALISVEKWKKKAPHSTIGWCNLNVFDFMGRMLSGRLHLHIWSAPLNFETDLKVNSLSGRNPAQDAITLEVTVNPPFDAVSSSLTEPSVVFPAENDIIEYGLRLLEARIEAEEENSGSGESVDTDTSLPGFMKSLAKDEVGEVLERYDLAELGVIERQQIWLSRRHCFNHFPNSLPKLLTAVPWRNRDAVSELYAYLSKWPTISYSAALDILATSGVSADPRVQRVALQVLDDLSEAMFTFYLPQLVQVLKCQLYTDNLLTRLLLRRALYNRTIAHFLFWHLRSEIDRLNASDGRRRGEEHIRLRFGLILEALLRSSPQGLLRDVNQQLGALDKLTALADYAKQVQRDDEEGRRLFLDYLSKPDILEHLEHIRSPLRPYDLMGGLLIEKCKVMKSKKRPIWLSWENPDPLAATVHMETHGLIFKSGDDLRQDMLTLQVISLMDRVWKEEGLDLRMIPYRCLSTGNNAGLIEVVRNSRTWMSIQRQSTMACFGADTKQLFRWIQRCSKDRVTSQQAQDNFCRSCAAYCVATFVLGIRDRHPDNIMVTTTGQVFHIDFGHFLDHRKKKFGINRERVPFILTEDFIRVIANGAENPNKSDEFAKFQTLCVRAYLVLRRHAKAVLSLFTMMVPCGIPELQSDDDIGYIRKTLALDKTEDEAVRYFNEQLKEAHGGSWSVKVDSVFHYLRNRTS